MVWLSGRLRFTGSKGSLFGALVLGVVFFGLGVIFVAVGIDGYRDGQATKSWPTTTGHVISADVQEKVETRRDMNDRPRTERTYTPAVRYEYTVGAQTYLGHRVKADDYGGGADRAYGIVNRYPAGTTLTVFYDPDDPDQAVLETGADTSGVYLFGGVGALFTVIGLAALAAAGVLFRRRNLGSAWRPAVSGLTPDGGTTA